ncbi:hypothetical protein [Fluviispira multicolorata]|uniref:Beta-ketoacyl-[acyl-carrier-protein] synthase III N-terminal domain-containing protein n=1 Tax=Fluviispira multicolorata TaxID=2654512 RepID=A0A833JAN6_9BACT|nr:hypothetical protein [Fluviispira multicolorata]KAB8028079.1 hypothetical protein GCL57_13590 [Fluviispira multicolorata]
MANIIQTIQYIKINLSFSYLPSRNIENKQIAANFKKDGKTLFDIESTIYKHTGILERRYGLKEEAASDLAIRAIQTSSVPLQDIGAMLIATTSGDYPSPSTATFVHKGLNLKKSVHCLDIASSCTSFLSALRCSTGFIATNTNTVVIATELKHKGLSEKDLRTHSLFADGASGVYLTKAQEEFFYFCYQETQSDLAKNICIPVGGSREPTKENNILRNKLEISDAKLMFLHTVKAIAKAIGVCWQEREFVLKSIKNPNFNKIPCTIYVHQANKNILNEVKNRLEKNLAENIPTLMSDVGNMVCASLPVLRTRILFLKALFFKCTKKIPKSELVDFFIETCTKDSCFSYNIENNGICFKTNYFNEEVCIFDGGSLSLKESWLAKISDEEYENLMPIFAQEYNLYLENKSFYFLDIWVAAGGGFQTIGLLHGNIKINS